MVPAGFGLVFSAVDRPVHGGVDELSCLVADVEQASDLGEGQANAASARRRGGLWPGVLAVVGLSLVA